MPPARIAAVVALIATAMVGCSTASSPPKAAATAAVPTPTPAFDLKASPGPVIAYEHVENGHHMFYNDIALLKLDDGSYLLYAIKHPLETFDPVFLNYYVAFRSRDAVNFDPAEIPITRPGGCNQGIPGVFRASPGYRMYCVVNNASISQGAPGGFIDSAYSTDGINFQLEPGKRLEVPDVQPCCPSAVYDLPDGRHRMLFGVDLARTGQGVPQSVVYGATSSDWLNWTLDSKSVLGSPSPSDGTQPKVVPWRGRYLMFYDTGVLGGSTRGWLGNDAEGNGIYVATSDDGLAFTKLWPLGIWGAETGATLLPDGRISLIYASGCCPQSLDAAIGTAQLSVALLTATGV